MVDIKIYPKGDVDWTDLGDRAVLDNATKTVTSNEDGTYETRLLPRRI